MAAVAGSWQAADGNRQQAVGGEQAARQARRRQAGRSKQAGAQEQASTHTRMYFPVVLGGLKKATHTWFSAYHGVFMLYRKRHIEREHRKTCLAHPVAATASAKPRMRY